MIKRQQKIVKVFLSVVDRQTSAIVEDMEIGNHLLAREIYQLAKDLPEEIVKVDLVNPMGYDVFLVDKWMAGTILDKEAAAVGEEDAEELRKLSEDYAWQVRILQ